MTGADDDDEWITEDLFLLDIGYEQGIAEGAQDHVDTGVPERVQLFVKGPGHDVKGVIAASLLRDHTQLVIVPAPHLDTGPDYGVHAANRWRVNDLQSKYALILPGVGWGSLSRSRVADDIAAGRLAELKPDTWEGSDWMPRFPLVVAYRKDKALGRLVDGLSRNSCPFSRAAENGVTPLLHP